MNSINKNESRKPAWLRRSLPKASAEPTRKIIQNLGLHTVCREACCPNTQECYSKGTATFIIAGKNCTRNCKFCSVENEPPKPLDPKEPEKVAQAVSKMNLKHVVITSVTRDDLVDGAAHHFALTIKAIRAKVPQATIEVLTPDFKGEEQLVCIVCDAEPNVFNHNIETVKRLTSIIRSHADYSRSMRVLKFVNQNYPQIKVKSGLMVGLGETDGEVKNALRDLRENGVAMVTIGQYLRPTPSNIAVTEYVEPSKFEEYAKFAKEIGFLEVASGPFVRSSYNAHESFNKVSTQLTY